VAATTPTGPTAAPVKQSDFPQKGKAITMIVSAGAGAADTCARLMAAEMEKLLETPLAVVNKPGAGWQVGLTELANAKPDGYTIGMTILPQVPTIYMDAERKAVFNRKSFQTLGNMVVDPNLIAVKPDSPYKDIKDLIEAAKANPRTIKGSTTGILSDDHISMLKLEQVTGAKLAPVHFTSGADAVNALLGGHVDAFFGNVGDFVSHFKSGTVRILGIFDKAESKYYPGVKTMEAQGYKLYAASSRGFSAPAGTPKEITDALAAAIKKGMDAQELKTRADQAGFVLQYMSPQDLDSYWAGMEDELKPLMPMAREQ